MNMSNTSILTVTAFILAGAIVGIYKAVKTIRENAKLAEQKHQLEIDEAVNKATNELQRRLDVQERLVEEWREIASVKKAKLDEVQQQLIEIVKALDELKSEYEELNKMYISSQKRINQLESKVQQQLEAR